MGKILCGLDIGTNSVGWCVTDENFKVIKKQGKSLWGVRLFDEAKDASERRGYRASRRRYNRQKERINLLQGLFEIPMKEVDPSFFLRLKESFYTNDDRTTPFSYTLFNDINYTDSQYYKQYPTIYHLRKALVYSEEKMDLRMIYLALHHMIKYRGNFLSEGSEFKLMDKEEAKEDFNKLNLLLADETTENDEAVTLSYDDEIFENLKKANKELSKLGERIDRFNELLNPNKNKFIKNVVVPMIVGKKVTIKNVGFENIEESDCDVKDIASDEDSELFEEKINKLLLAFPDQENKVQILLCCQKIYQFFLLGKLLGDNKYLCDAMIEKYNEHKRDLKSLKNYIKEYHPEEYSRLFRKPIKDEGNYSSYIGSYIYNGGPAKRFGRSGQKEKFYKTLKSILEKDKDSNFAKEVIAKIDSGTYLSLLNSTSNGVFPYQLNLLGMKEILEKQAKFYSFLNEKDEDGTIADKIISLLTFKIPYYVGPLNTKSNHAWVVRKDGKIYPWNFDKMVNKDESANEFIKRMLNRCTYLPSEYCLPKDSLVFTYYNVLSFLNKLQVNGSLISFDDKMDVVELFKNKRKVTEKDIKELFKKKTGNKDEEIEIATSKGKSISNIACNMASYYDFSNILGEDFVKENIALIENIIQDIVIFEDKNILEKRLKEIYGIQDEKIIRKIKGLNYSKYGRLSKAFLLDLKAKNQEDGKVYGSIINIMEKTNQNLEEIINNPDYHFDELIKEFNDANSDIDKDVSIETYVDELYVNPGMKRALIQAYKIVDEIEKIIKKPIDEYYVECTRSNTFEKRPTQSRYEKLKELYKEASKTAKEDKHFQELVKHLDEIDSNKFQSDKYYLYFLQMGRCMYSGEPIELDSLSDTSKYDIDHIYPQSIVKDDSFDNRVLVKQEFNREKTDIYPIPNSILFKGNFKEANKFYSFLKDKKFISDEKYKRLTRREPLKEEEYAAFVNRQLVYTSQAVAGFIKAIKFFKTKDGKSPKIVYSKAEIVSDFRKQYNLVKSRIANNFHHAHDAYLNIVVGKSIDVYFSKYRFYKEMHDKGLTTNFKKIFNKNIHDAANNIVWDSENSIAKIKHQMYECYDILTTTRTYYGSILFKKATIYPKAEGNIGVKSSGPLSNTERYGGLNGYSFGSYALIKSNENTILEAIPTVFADNLNQYLKNIYNDNYEVLVPKLKINTAIEDGKKKCCITGKTNDRYFLKNLYEKHFTYDDLLIIHKIEKLQEKITKKGLSKKSPKEIAKALGMEEKDGKIVISVASNKNTKQIDISSDECIKIYKALINIYQKEIYSYTSTITLIDFLKEKEELFIEKSLLEKSIFLYKLLSYLSCNERTDIDLSLLGGKPRACTITVSNRLKSCKIISESITGFYKKVIWEVK